MLYRFISAASLLSLASAANFNVQVGPGLTYTPNTVTGAAKGDTITFTFQSVHDVVQMSLDNPCQPLANGISVSQQTEGGTFVATLESADPQYFYCSVAGHCAAGMVMAVNLPAGTTIEQVSAATQGKASGQPPNGAQGGTLGTGGSATTTAASSGGATTTAAGTSSAASAAPASTSTKSGFAEASAIPAALAVVAGAVAALF